MSRAKYNNVTVKENRQKNKLKKHCVQSSHQRHQNFITDIILVFLLPYLNNVRPRHMCKNQKHLIMQIYEIEL